MPQVEPSLAISDLAAFMDRDEPTPKPAVVPTPAPAPVKPAETPNEPVRPVVADKPATEPVKPAEAEETIPRSKKQWDDFKESRRVEREKLQSEITAREARIKEFEQKLTEAQAATAKATPEPDADIKAKLENVEKLNRELSERITTLDVTKDPRFETYFGQKFEAQHQIARNILGAEKAKEWDEAMKLPDGEWKDQQIENLTADLTPLRAGQIGNVLNALRLINAERDTEIQNAEKHKGELATRQQEAAKTRTAKMDGVFNSTLARLQGQEEGHPLFQLKAGDTEWNAAVAQRIADAKALFTGQGIKDPSVVARAALVAAAAPDAIKAWQQTVNEHESVVKAKDDEIAKLSAQVKALSGAQPSGGATDGGDGKKEIFTKNMNPFQVAQAFAAQMNAD